MSYINAIDINGVIYNLGSLTDGDHEVNLPSSLNADDTFLLQGDVVNNLNGTQSNKPLSANQGRALNEQIKSLKDSSTSQVDNLSNEIDKLRTDMSTNDSTTLSAAKSYADTKCDETLTSANKYTDDSCAIINKSISDLKSTVESDTGVSDLRMYVDNTFIGKTNIANDLSTDSIDKVLSAKQGKVLDEKKLNVSGGTISGNVTINGTLTMGDPNGISVVKTPTANNDVTNKKYVDDKISNYTVKDNSIITTMIVDGAITKAKLGEDIILDTSEIGDDGNWTYVKMSNGVAIVWGSFENSTGVGFSGEFYEAYPSNLFISSPVCTPFLYTNGKEVIQFSKSAGDKDNTPKIGVYLFSSLINPGTSETLGAIKVDYIAIGKWK